MWQSAHDLPLPPSWIKFRSLKAARPLANISHGLTSQLNSDEPVPFLSCPKPDWGSIDARTAMKAAARRKMVDPLNLYMFDLRIALVDPQI